MCIYCRLEYSVSRCNSKISSTPCTINFVHCCMLAVVRFFGSVVSGQCMCVCLNSCAFRLCIHQCIPVHVGVLNWLHIFGEYSQELMQVVQELDRDSLALSPSVFSRRYISANQTYADYLRVFIKCQVHI